MSQTVTYDKPEPLFVQLSLTDPRSAEHEALRDRIIDTCLPLAENVARRFAGRGETFEDLLQTARVGLVIAVDRYDVTHGAPFLGFAVPTVMGEVRRHFRDRTWALHVPRRDKELYGWLRPATEKLTRELDRSPTAYELADELGVDITDVTRAMTASEAHHTRSLDLPVPDADGGPGMSIADSIGDEDPFYALTEDALTVGPLLAQLSDEDRQLLSWRYYDSLTQSDIAERVGLSQMSVSRKLTRILTRLRAQAGDIEAA
ncbi:RNA polymerase subunit sigma [Nocardia sp. MH4]|uniref:SigB/SigF/SigG family RNA polymerase sigma factor n=1 Tax=Nocardia sp. MH4 TaxID=1768677 RepID=UPI001C4EDCCD|nr:SigB/SigF/SigG family RNA polymerase sigma factor [Nocardia sp. MH4]MBW0271775.1 RNA polymerase subunit sigma [Nocardia sp. MH4]